jgi:hypothetical protein
MLTEKFHGEIPTTCESTHLHRMHTPTNLIGEVINNNIHRHFN